VTYLILSVTAIKPSGTAPTFGSLLTMILWMPFGAIGEELGWRGFLHTKLNTKMRGLFSSILVGILWMPIHITFLSQGITTIFLLALLIISFSIVIFALVQDIGFNVCVASIFHLFINITNLFFLNVIHERGFMAINALVWVALAVIVVIKNKESFLASKG
jgi:uncharacterized protein